MRLALLKGNRFNPWHLIPFTRLPDRPEVVGFRAESEIQGRFGIHGSELDAIAYEPIYYASQQGNPANRFYWRAVERLTDRTPPIVPFSDRLKDFDVVQSWELFTDWTEQALDAKRDYGAPVSLMIWDNIPFNAESRSGMRERKARAAAEADIFIVHSERSRRMLDMEGVPADKVRLVRPGVDLERFSPGAPRTNPLGTPAEAFTILFVGWLLPRKGADFLIMALRELLHDPDLKTIPFHLVMIGADPGKPRLEALIRRLDVGSSCTFLGPAKYDTMADAYRSADVFVLPSIATETWQEQFGMSLLEAMASGTPVVATQSGAIPEMTNDAARVCQPNDFLSLYEAIKDLALDPPARERLADAGRARAERLFDVNATASELSSIYRELTELKR